MNRILKSYFYWTYPRGSFHYDVMVTLILAFIFITPRIWNYNDKPPVTNAKSQPLTVIGDGAHGLIITVQASALGVKPDSAVNDIKRALKKAVEPVLGDSVYVDRWEIVKDGAGNASAWKVWAHR